MLNAVIIGASGYTGAELARILTHHPEFNLTALYVSRQSADAHQPLSALYPQLAHCVELPLLPLENVSAVAEQADVVFLATAHEVSHDLAPHFYAKGCQVFDLSGAFRVNNREFYPQFYGFSHQYPELLQSAVYGLPEWTGARIVQTNLVAVAGCYPTVSQLCLKPLIEAGLLDDNVLPVINAVSGVSGAGRKASLKSSFCEVSLQPYGVFNHRHQPEIATHLGREVIFTPHLGNFKRGILATITAKLAQGVNESAVQQAFEQAYANAPLVRLCSTLPAVAQVQQTPFCDIGFRVQHGHIIIVGAEDNLLKGAAAQAVQCANIRNQFEQTLGLI
ncbi:N-acetyl-gamma-glutamyl-phosphate reductase [Pasteurellaceae bacterium HPA106]|uniref:N-acetyl-gamma-glutamyl-phosphate reductase n=1 Tax=Spirabiliibacterium pneumoniae TaxID=221400 RepID=UPI001AAC4EED|nr:N-acetyl-gamma-glutamyl-phosphate reductase [Spirabiliibacterium pneumoniae]MBE2896078.1 N-acetyl-gamma-glutamyl-phosphate reductase [Spirabiliibacterium pneumoniae]